MSDLKPCPFCGAQPRIVTEDVEPQGDPWYGEKRETFVRCACGCCLFDGEFHEGFHDAETRAVAAWNTRTPSCPNRPSGEGGDIAKALHDAATSLETIASLAGRKTYGEPPIETYLDTFLDVRLYAAARARAAREVMPLPSSPKEQP